MSDTALALVRDERQARIFRRVSSFGDLAPVVPCCRERQDLSNLANPDVCVSAHNCHPTRSSIA